MKARFIASLLAVAAMAGCQSKSSAPKPPIAGRYQTPPGAEPHPAALQRQLEGAVDSKGAAYGPRTRHKTAGGKAKYVNRLILEASPYLQQHAHNPVNWYPWCDEAFAEAKRLGRPVIRSVGYTTSHWCHGME